MKRSTLTRLRMLPTIDSRVLCTITMHVSEKAKRLERSTGSFLSKINNSDKKTVKQTNATDSVTCRASLASLDDRRRGVREQLSNRWGQSRPLYRRSPSKRRRRSLHNPGKFISAWPRHCPWEFQNREHVGQVSPPLEISAIRGLLHLRSPSASGGHSHLRRASRTFAVYARDTGIFLFRIERDDDVGRAACSFRAYVIRRHEANDDYLAQPAKVLGYTATSLFRDHRSDLSGWVDEGKKITERIFEETI